MDNDGCLPLLAILVPVVAISLILGCVTGRVIEFSAQRSALVESGHAEYYLDANRARQWRMKECDK